MHIRLLSTLLTTLLLASTALAQKVRAFQGPDPDRKSTSALLLDESFVPQAGVAIDYSAPTWKEEYNGMLDKLKGRDARLGKNFWTTFSTMTDCEVGGTKIAAGSYFLGLRCDKDGNFHLLVLDQATNLKAKAAPWMANTWKGGVACAMTLAKDSLADSAELMQIEVAMSEQDPAAGKLSIRWGKHELWAPLKLVVGSAK